MTHRTDDLRCGSMGEPPPADHTDALRKQALGMVAYVRAAAEKHDKLAKAPGASPEFRLAQEASAAALRVVAAELAEFYT